ncbi:MAG: aminoacetone oxidase family FAD-binding enzyme, partial [Campylobacterota bacterium]|nr:aminoacetone oxidase family FAD-binding enzyme [Campylobacterota bacterium]
MVDVAILGAGASGLMTAALLHNKSVCIIENNTAIGAKIKVSGGAKCNITNEYLSNEYFLGDAAFIDAVLKQMNNIQLLKFLNDHNLYPKLNPKIVKGTYFCNSSSDVIEMFQDLIKKHQLLLNTKVISVDYDEGFIITTSTTIIRAKKLVVASGGLSYVQLGASKIGYDIASQFGHTLNKQNPALVGFTVQKDQFWFKELSGLSVDVAIRVENKTIKGSMLFTHKGCSGPAILTTSLYWKKGQISIDFLPNKNSYLPKRFIKAFKQHCINAQQYKEELRNYCFAPAGNFGYTKAEVTKGGVSTQQIDSYTMQSQRQKGLYFVGEVLDVT